MLGTMVTCYAAFGCCPWEVCSFLSRYGVGVDLGNRQCGGEGMGRKEGKTVARI